jgi:hypothetical protein
MDGGSSLARTWNAAHDPDRLVVTNAGEILYRVEEAEPHGDR